MKVKDVLVLLPENQEIQVHCKDYGHYSSYPFGLLHMGGTCTKCNSEKNRN